MAVQAKPEQCREGGLSVESCKARQAYRRQHAATRTAMPTGNQNAKRQQSFPRDLMLVKHPWSWWALNPRPVAHKTTALTTELQDPETDHFAIFTNL